jgi:hypothetical protein
LGLGLAAAALAVPPARAAEAPSPVWPEPDGTLILAQPFARSEIALRLSRRLAGAIDTLTWDGVAFLEPGDQGGGALQATATLGPDGRRADEAGRAVDGTGATAASRLETLRYGRSWAETESRMAWRLPGTARAGAAPGVILRRRVALGLPGLGNAIEVQASFVVSEAAATARFEPVAATVPAAFSEAWRFDPATGAISRIEPAPGDRPDPVILALPEGSHALAVWSPSPPANEAAAARASFSVEPGAGATRLSCAFRVADVAAGAHDFACYLLVGSLADVRGALRVLNAPQ